MTASCAQLGFASGAAESWLGKSPLNAARNTSFAVPVMDVPYTATSSQRTIAYPIDFGWSLPLVTSVASLVGVVPAGPTIVCAVASQQKSSAALLYPSR